MLTKSGAISRLSQNYRRNICLIEVLKHDKDCRLLYAEDDGVIVTTFDGIYLCDLLPTANKREIIESLTDVKVALATDKETALLIKEKFGIGIFKECYQNIWEGGLIEEDKAFDVVELSPDVETVKTIVKIYRGGWNEETVVNAIKREGMYGVYIGESLVAFAGWHSELSLGMLEVLPEYRRQGIATAIGASLINATIKKGRVPFGHIVSDNFKSLNLSKKSGFSFYDGFVYWVG